MLRSCIEMVFKRSRQHRKLLLNRYMMASGNGGINPQITLFLAKSSQLHTHHSCCRRHGAKEAYSALRDSAKMSGNSYELMKSIKSPTILEWDSFRLIR